MQKKKHSAEFKAQIALEALKEQKTINEIASQSGVHVTQINNWKKQA
ncbi:transposase, partial [Synechocystis salina LEGE 06099]